MSPPTGPSLLQPVIDEVFAESAAYGTAHPDGRQIVSLVQLVADDGAGLRALLAKAAPVPAVAATFVAGWTAGSLGAAVGAVHARTGAGLCVDASTVRLTLAGGGWPEGLDIGASTVVVAPEHAWSTRTDVVVLTDEDAVRRRAVTALREAAAPVVEALRGMVEVGRAGLWNEVGDHLAAVLSHQVDVPVDREVVDRLAATIRCPGAPWRAKATVQLLDAPHGPAAVYQRGGCCRFYTLPGAGSDADGGPNYCSTCSLRSPADVRSRQLTWLEQHHRSRRAAG